MLPKERYAWIWLTTLVIVFSAYFATISMMERHNGDLPFLTRIGILAIALSTLGVVALTTYVVQYLQRRARGDIDADERDRLIDWRASTMGYYVLMAGMIIVGCYMPFTSKGWEIVHAALLSIAAAEIVHSAMVVSGYRRGWRV